MENTERIVHDGNTYVYYENKWLLIDGPLHKKLMESRRKNHTQTITLFTWDGEICDQWERYARFVKDGVSTETFIFHGGELPPGGRYARVDLCDG